MQSLPQGTPGRCLLGAGLPQSSPWPPADTLGSTKPFPDFFIPISWQEPLFNSRKYQIRSLKPAD